MQKQNINKKCYIITLIIKYKFHMLKLPCKIELKLSIHYLVKLCVYTYVKNYTNIILCITNEINSCKFNLIDTMIRYSYLINNPINISQ